MNAVGSQSWELIFGEGAVAMSQMSRKERKCGLSPKKMQMFKETVFGEDSPGAILRDFKVLLDFIMEKDVPVGDSQQPTVRILPEINARLTRPLDLDLKRPVMKSYPHIRGLYLLLRASGLGVVASKGKKLLLRVDETTYRSYRSLNPTEQYFTLLETWLLRAVPDIIGEPAGFRSVIRQNFREWGELFGMIPDEGIQAEREDMVGCSITYGMGWHSLALLELFGLITVQLAPPGERKRWPVERVFRTPFGDGLLALLTSYFSHDVSRIYQWEEEGAIPFGSLQPVFQPCFPAWKNNLSVSEAGFQEGVHIFRIAFEGMRFRIAIPGSCTLDELASTILHAVDFDFDHLYQFTYRNRFGSLMEVNHPYMKDLPRTDELAVGETGLCNGGMMTFTYDFGDDWKFNLVLEAVDVQKHLREPVLLDVLGKPPEQYRRWEE